MARVFLGLGANVGDARGTICRAVQMLSERLRVVAVSPLYETAPVGYLDQPRFLNAVLEAETEVAAMDLLALVKDLEITLGRQPSVRWGPRAIDIDILLYGDDIVSLPALTIPHQRMCERPFALVPLAALAPDLGVPGTGATVAEHLARVGRQDVRKLEGEGDDLARCIK
ncbi:MAG: 2-amino-4-hydroxy-6-hydroxymethyldihydropteridine diphosphokinase [Chloroflexota bacterium]